MKGRGWIVLGIELQCTFVLANCKVLKYSQTTAECRVILYTIIAFLYAQLRVHVTSPTSSDIQY